MNPPDIHVEECSPLCFVSYRLQPEDGKINLNYLVRSVDDEPGEQYRAMVDRLFGQYGIPLDLTDSLIDWIDQNDYTEGNGAEQRYYSTLVPPRKIKNFPLFSLSEVGMVKGASHELLYGSKAPEGWKEEQEDLKFQTEDEKNLITEDDWIPANNLTAYYTDPDVPDDRININTARYHVLMSLSDAMSREAVLALMKMKRQNGYYIKNLNILETLPEFQVPTSLGVTLYEELTGGGGKTGKIKTEGRIYRIVGVGSILPASDNSTKKPVVRKVTALYDKALKRVIYYSEE